MLITELYYLLPYQRFMVVDVIMSKSTNDQNYFVHSLEIALVHSSAFKKCLIMTNNPTDADLYNLNQ